MPEVEIQFTVNGISRKICTAPHRTLLQVLREDLGLTGAKDGCSKGDCGACVVVMDNRAVNACLVLAARADGKEILTVEGLASDGRLSHLQQAFAEKWGLQCGFCTPGMLMSSYALLLSNPQPSDEEIKRAIAGNLCRCTGYSPVIDSVRHAAALAREAGHVW
ncbi:MAG: (2Fe-2S)-binding protein [Chloroflexi bacterium]|nr:(2Fe-2S)-binding protein [Chloroflexota bacterium]